MLKTFLLQDLPKRKHNLKETKAFNNFRYKNGGLFSG